MDQTRKDPRNYRERKDKDKSSIICYECEKPGHFKSKCLDLDKTDHKKKHFKPKDKKVLMSTWEELDDTLFVSPHSSFFLNLQAVYSREMKHRKAHRVVKYLK